MPVDENIECVMVTTTKNISINVKKDKLSKHENENCLAMKNNVIAFGPLIKNTQTAPIDIRIYNNIIILIISIMAPLIACYYHLSVTIN